MSVYKVYSKKPKWYKFEKLNQTFSTFWAIVGSINQPRTYFLLSDPFQEIFISLHLFSFDNPLL